MSRTSILCAIDFTHASDEALSVAIKEARRRDAILDLVHVWYPADPLVTDMAGIGIPITHPESPAHLRQEFESIPVDLPPQQVRRHLEVGTAADRIVNKAKELDSSLLVVGTHARGVIGRWFIGSVANELLRMSPCPILVCRQPHAVTDDQVERNEQDTEQRSGPE